MRTRDGQQISIFVVVATNHVPVHYGKPERRHPCVHNVTNYSANMYPPLYSFHIS